ncbi:MAG TPA: hypothetical protein VF140_08905 [Phycicoccus sp.]
MSAGWVAATVGARAMSRRRLGREAVRELAGAPDLQGALGRLVRSPYGREVRVGMTLAEAERAVVAAAVWNVRVLSGWLPREGVRMLRVLVSPVEVADVVDHLEHLYRGAPGPGPVPFRLGALATAWPRLAGTTTPDELRAALAVSPWGDPGGTSPREVALALRLAACDRIASAVPAASGWATGSAALLLARELAAGRPLPPRVREDVAAVLGTDVAEAPSLAALPGVLPRGAAPALAGVSGPEDLWRAEARWWTAVERDAFRLARGSRPGPDSPVAAVALLAVDAWRVRAALESAARHGRALEDFDAVA